MNLFPIKSGSWLILAALICGPLIANAQDENELTHIAVIFKGQKDPKNAGGFRAHKLSPELRALQKIEGAVLVGSTKRNEAVIVTTKKAAGRLLIESEREGLDLNTDVSGFDRIDRIILSYTDKPPTPESLQPAGLEIVEDYKAGTFLVVKPAKGQQVTKRTADALLAHPQVKRAYPSYRMSVNPPDPSIDVRPKADPNRATDASKKISEWPKPNSLRSLVSPIVPNDEDYARLWGIRAINAPIAWSVTTDSPVVVAVIDTGVDYNHPDLNANMWRSPSGTFGYNAITGRADPMDDNGHGTHCAGTIAGVANNKLGVVGVTWNVKVMGVKFLGSDGSGSDIDAIKGIDFAVGHGAKVLSNSWGGPGFVPELDEAIQRAHARGALFIAAAGNANNDNDGAERDYPASYERDNVISVMSIDQDGQKSSFSNYGRTNVHLAAPGRNIFSTYPGRAYKSLNGTSMATPHVAGAAALIWGHPSFRGANWQAVKRALESNVARLPSLTGLCATEGILDLEFLADTTSPPPVAPPVTPPVVTPPVVIPPVATPSPNLPPVVDGFVIRASANFKRPLEVVDAANLLHVELQLAEPSEVWIHADTSVTSDRDVVDASISFLNEESVNRRWGPSARHFSLTAGRWTAVSASYTRTLPAGRHDLYWKLWDVDSNNARLRCNAGTMTVQAVPVSR